MAQNQPFSPRSSFAGNRLLAALPEASLHQLAPHLRPMLFHLKAVLFEPGSPSEAVFFPKAGALSLVLSSASGIDVEVGLIGSEGVVGGLDALSGAKNSTRAQVQIAGSGWTLSAPLLRQAFAQNSEFQRLFLSHQSALSNAASQNIVCNRLHSIEQRAAKWLLMVHDRVKDDDITLTHDFLATMLGSRRAAVSLAAQSLRDVGLIDYRRGSISILDRQGLETLACECYSVLQSLFPLQASAPTEAQLLD